MKFTHDSTSIQANQPSLMEKLLWMLTIILMDFGSKFSAIHVGGWSPIYQNPDSFYILSKEKERTFLKFKNLPWTPWFLFCMIFAVSLLGTSQLFSLFSWMYLPPVIWASRPCHVAPNRILNIFIEPSITLYAELNSHVNYMEDLIS